MLYVMLVLKCKHFTIICLAINDLSISCRAYEQKKGFTKASDGEKRHFLEQYSTTDYMEIPNKILSSPKRHMLGAERC